MNADADYTRIENPATWTVHEGGIPYGDYRQKEAKQMLLQGEQHRYDPRLVKRFGASAALVACQLLYWDGKQHDASGWIYKSRREWVQETGLSERQIRKARNVLKQAEVLHEEKRKGVPPRLYYRLDFFRLNRIISESGEKGDSNCATGGTDECDAVGTVERYDAGTDDWTDGATDIQRLHSQITAQTTSKDTPLQGAVAAPPAPTPAQDIYEIKEEVNRQGFIQACNRHPEWWKIGPSASALAATVMQDLAAPESLADDYETLAADWLKNFGGG